MTIKEIEAAVGLPRASVRYYESEGLISPSRGENGYRNYSERDLEDLKKIKLLRELECPIEEIAAVKNGTRPLSDVLDACLARLRGDGERVERALSLCERIRSDRTSWERLEPERYADAVSPARFPEPEVRDVRHSIPFRRYFARTLDYAFCNVIWMAVLALMRVNPVADGLVLEFFGAAASLFLMLAAEPLFLSTLGTTPGKAILGLKLTRSDGSLLSYREAAKRTANVIVFGMGLELPVVALITNILAYRRCRNEWGQPWESDDEAWSDFAAESPGGFWDAKGSRPRAVGFAAACLFLALAAVGTVFAAARPVHTGALTIAEFAENYNQYCDFAGLEPSDERMASDGTLEHGQNVVYADGNGDLGFEYETEGELLKAVTYTYTAPVESVDPVRSMVFIPTDRITAMMNAFTGHGAVALGEWKNVIDNVTCPREGTYSASGDGWSVTCTLETKGYIPVEGCWFLAEDGQDEHRFLYLLRVERTD